MRESNYILILWLICAGLTWNSADGILCYTCTWNEKSGDNSTCLLKAERVTDCDKKYCTIMRVEYLSPPGKVQSFIRGCENAHNNGIVTDEQYKTYYRACVFDLCNNKTGKEQSSSNDFGAAENTIIAGRSHGAILTVFGPILIILSIFVNSV